MCIPVVNAPFVLLFDDIRYTDMFGGILTATFQSLVSFPLYILDVSYILVLETKKSFMWNVLQLIFVLFTFSIAPNLFAWRESEDCDPIIVLFFLFSGAVHTAPNDSI